MNFHHTAVFPEVLTFEEEISYAIFVKDATQLFEESGKHREACQNENARPGSSPSPERRRIFRDATENKLDTSKVPKYVDLAWKTLDNQIRKLDPFRVSASYAIIWRNVYRHLDIANYAHPTLAPALEVQILDLAVFARFKLYKSLKKRETVALLTHYRKALEIVETIEGIPILPLMAFSQEHNPMADSGTQETLQLWINETTQNRMKAAWLAFRSLEQLRSLLENKLRSPYALGGVPWKTIDALRQIVATVVKEQEIKARACCYPEDSCPLGGLSMQPSQPGNVQLMAYERQLLDWMKKMQASGNEKDLEELKSFDFYRLFEAELTDAVQRYRRVRLTCVYMPLLVLVALILVLWALIVLREIFNVNIIVVA